MTSRRLTTLLQKWDKQQTPTLLIQILAQAFNDEDYQLISDMVDDFSGKITPEMHFLAGESLAKLDKKESAIQHLLIVLESNPQHFKATQLLDSLGYEEETEESEDTEKQAIASFKEIMIPELPLQETASYRSNRRKYFALATLFTLVAITLLITFFWHTTKDFYIDTTQPRGTLYPISWSDYQVKSARIKKWVSLHKASEESRTASFFLSAYTIIDHYLIDDDKDLLSKVRFYFALTKKKTVEMEQLNRYIEHKTASDGIEHLNMLEYNYPRTIEEIKRIPVSPPAIIKKENLRKSLYDALILLRQNKLSKALTLTNNILTAFPQTEIAQKLFVLIQAYTLTKNSAHSIDKQALLKTLSEWKTESPERHFLAEAWMVLGTATSDPAVIEEGFYLGCPRSYWCEKTVRNFLENGKISLARRMAEYMKNKRGLNRQASDITLVLETAYADEDFGNCYFSYKELKQFFPTSINIETAKIAAICSENNGYYEEAEELYRIVAEGDASPQMSAKIAEMKWLVHEDETSLEELEQLYIKNPENRSVLISYLTVLSRGNDLQKTIDLIDTLFDKMDVSQQQSVINRYIVAGALAPALKKLKKLKKEEWAQNKLYTIYCANLQFALAKPFNTVPNLTYKRTCSALEQASQLINQEKYDEAVKILMNERRQITLCDPAISYMLAEAYRHKGESQLTFSMIDSMLECDKNYLPGLVFTAGIAFYQGDLKAAEGGIEHILKREKLLSVLPHFYHNELVLIQGDMLISRGKTNQLIPFLSKNMIRGTVIRVSEQEKLDDLYDKLKVREKTRLKRFINRTFKKR